MLAADEDRRRLERELHDGLQQQLTALAVSVQLAESVVDADPSAAKALLRDLTRDLRRAADEAARLAQQIYLPPLQQGGLAAALRFATVNAGVQAAVDVSAGSSYPPEVVQTIHLCWLDALEKSAGEARIVVQDTGEELAFEIVRDRASGLLDHLRPRVEALGGRLTVTPEGSRARVTGALPVSESP